MLDIVVGPVTSIFDNRTFQMNVTHIGKHNKFRYNNFETIFIDENRTSLPLSQLHGYRLRCQVKYRDEYNRLYSIIEFE